MRQFKLIHEAESKAIVRTLDEAFMEALALAEGGGEAYEHDEQLFKLIQADHNWLDAFKDEYKIDIIEAYGFTILEEIPAAK